MKHELNREHGTDDPNAMGYMDWTRVTCSCGWKSRKVHNYSNTKMSTLLAYEMDHKRDIRNNLRQPS